MTSITATAAAPVVTSETAQTAMARTYANAGWAVFPVAPVGKLPLIPAAHPKGDPMQGQCKGGCGRWGHGVYDATRDLDVIADWWRREPNANIGLPAHGNGLAILDVDPGKGGDTSFTQLNAYALSQGVDLTATLSQYTGGDGMHYVFAEPEGGIGSRAGKSFGPDLPGLDTRGRGGYVVAAPSIHASGGVYQWVDFFADIAPWPQLLTQLMTPAPQPTPGYTGPAGGVGDTTKYADKALDKELAILRSAAQGGQNDQLNSSSYYLGQLVGAGLLDGHRVRGELYNAAVANGYVGRDGARQTINTIDSGMNAGSQKPRDVKPRAGAR